MADTTYYVSNTATNGYSLGVNSGAGTTKETAFLTPEYAFGVAAIVTGSHTIIHNDGVYLGTGLGVAGFLQIGVSPTAAGITLKAENTGTVFYIPSSVTAVVRISNTLGWGGKIIVFIGLSFGRDTESVGVDPNYIFLLGNSSMASDLNVTFTNCALRNALFYSIFPAASTLLNLTFTDSSHLMDRVLGRSLIYTPTVASGNLTINGLSVNHTLHDVTNHGMINWGASASGVTCSLSDISGTFSINPASTTTGNTFAIQIANCDNVTIDDCVLTLTSDAPNSDYSVYGIRVYGNDAALTATAPIIRRCSINAAGWTGSGFGITIGGDGGGRQPNKSDNGKIHDCSFSGDTISAANGIHGIGVVENDNCEVYGCTSSFADIGFLSKLTDTCNFIGNLASKCGGGSTNAAYYNKGGTDDNFWNNTAVLDSDSDSIAFLSTIEGTTNTTGAAFSNNLVAVLSATTKQLITINASQTATFDYNYYVTIGELPTVAFSYQGTTYATVALWTAARETNGVDLGSVDPMTDVVNNDYSPALGSALIGTSPKNWTGINPTGADGEPLADFGTDIGGIQSKHNPFHPVNL